MHNKWYVFSSTNLKQEDLRKKKKGGGGRGRSIPSFLFFDNYFSLSFSLVFPNISLCKFFSNFYGTGTQENGGRIKTQDESTIGAAEGAITK
jgi:hypothetical protein